jgi:hypothetical protein
MISRAVDLAALAACAAASFGCGGSNEGGTDAGSDNFTDAGADLPDAHPVNPDAEVGRFESGPACDGSVDVAPAPADPSPGVAADAAGPCSAPTWSASAKADPAALYGYASSRKSAVRLPDGRILLTGGYSGGAPSADVRVYDPVADVWLALTAMHDARVHHDAALLADGKVLVTGGEPYDTLSSVEIIDPTGAAPPKLAAPMLSPRAAHTLVTLPDGRVLAVGGRPDGSNFTAAKPMSEVYDPKANVWTNADTPCVGAPWLLFGIRPARLPSGKLLFTSIGDFAARAYVFDPTTTSWSLPAQPRFRAQSARQYNLRDGRVAWFGERTDAEDAGWKTLLMPAFYDESTDSWTRGTMIVGRSVMHVTERLCGEVLVIAGEYDHGVAMFFDAVHGSWRNTSFGKLAGDIGEMSVVPSRNEGFTLFEDDSGHALTFE